MPRAVITGTGMAAPPKIVTNDDIAKIVETSDEWIVQRTGIRERRVCAPEETSSTLSIEAAKQAMATSKLDPKDLDGVIVATVTADHLFPSCACMVQTAIGANNAGAFDLGAACAGFISATMTASALIESGNAKKILVVGVDVLTKFMDWKDRGTCVLFGDGAGAVVLEATDNTDRGVLTTVLLSDGSGGKHIQLDRGGSRYPNHMEYSEEVSPYIHMAGAEVYRFAVGAMGDACERVLERTGLKPDDIDLFVPHQANLRIIRSSQEKLGLPDEKVFVNVDRYGNTSGGSIPLALHEAVEQGRLKQGDLVMTVGFGAGLVWGANLIRW